MKGRSKNIHHYGYGELSMNLFACGTEYYDYGAAFAEQGINHGKWIEHAYHCDFCTVFGTDIRGPRFLCLDCIGVDFCAGHYANWEKSDGEMDFCKGHRFYEIPRPCWYQFKDGVVMEDGSTLPEVIDFLEKRFTALLQDVRGQMVSQLVVKHGEQGDRQ